MNISRQFAWFRSMRWGRNAPGAVLWWICSPIGQNIIIDEFKFQHADPAEVAQVIRERDAALGMCDANKQKTSARYLAAEPELWEVDRGPTIAELFARAGIPMVKSSSDRVQGWNQLAAEIKRTVTDPRQPNESPQPALVIAARCTMLKRSLPLLREGKTKKEDIEPTPDACLVEALRIGIMSRPSPTVVGPLTPPPGTLGYELQEAREHAASGMSDESDYYG